MLFITAFSIGFGPIPWILNVELIPPEARVISVISVTGIESFYEVSTSHGLWD